MHSEADVDPVLVVVKPLLQLLHVAADSELSLKLPSGQTWQFDTVEFTSWQPYPIPHGEHWEHSTTRLYGWSMRSTSKRAKCMLIEEKRGRKFASGRALDPDWKV